MATNPKLPDLLEFTRAELAERWKCDISRIDRYIDEGQLKEGFNTFRSDYNYLRELRYYVACGNKDMHGVAFEMMAHLDLEYYRTGKKHVRLPIIGCPKYLYISVLNPKDFVIPRVHTDPVKPGVFDFAKKMVPSKDRTKRDDLILRFCDLENNTLFPMRSDHPMVSEMVSIEKPKQKDLIIPLEEILRFEKEHGIGENKQILPAAGRQEKIAEKRKEDIDTPSQETSDNAAGDNKHSSSPEERILRMNEVIKRVGISRPHIYKLMDEGQFPKNVKLTGNRAVGWYESVIDKWIKDRDEQRRKDGEEADE